jgi:hypothetical protein
MTLQMKKMKITTALITAGMAMTLIGARISPESLATTDTYGVCGCVSESNTKCTFKLELNEDKSFHYIDQSGSSKIDITGKWLSAGRSIQLTGFSDNMKIHDQWKIDKEGNCIQSRKGLEFVRLCNLGLCK